jgi:hypothetical protein
VPDAKNLRQQLSTRNLTEKIVDKDNHLRDCLKYMLLACLEPPEKTWQQKVAQEVAPIAARGDLTSCLMLYEKRKAEAEAGDRPATIGRYSRSAWEIGVYSKQLELLRTAQDGN